MNTNWNLKSAFFAATLSVALAFGMTTGQAVFYPDTAQAGVLGKIKGAAKAVGGGVKKAAVTVGSAGKKVGVGVGSGVNSAAIAAGKAAAKTPPVKAVINAARAARDAARKIPGKI
jgi:hypothetical protein